MFISSLLPTLHHFLKLLLFIAFLKGTLLLFLYFQVVYAENAFVESSFDFSEIVIGPILSGIEYITPCAINYNILLIVFIFILLALYHAIGLIRKAEIRKKMKR